MLELQNVSLATPHDADSWLLREVSASFPQAVRRRRRAKRIGFRMRAEGYRREVRKSK